MTEERRAFPRYTLPIDGSWRGAAGAGTCRIADLSWGGCFIETKASPAIGELTVLTVPVPSGAVELTAAVVMVERGIGFSVRFAALSAGQFDALYPVLGEPAPPRPIE